MPKATVDIPRTAPQGPDNDLCFTAVVMALADLLIEQRVFSRAELEIRAQSMVESPEILSTADFVKVVAQRVFEKRLTAQFEKAKENTSNLPPVPQYRMK